MDLKELNKTQLVLLTLLITFVVSIATAIVTVSLMKQMPKDIPQTINNIIERTIEKVTTVQTPAPVVSKDNSVKIDENKKTDQFFGNSEALVSIYSIDQKEIPAISETNNGEAKSSDNQNQTTDQIITENNPKALGQGVVISDVGLILVDSNILNDSNVYNVDLNKKMFEASVLKKFSNSFTVLKISSILLEKPAIETTSQPKTN